MFKTFLGSILTIFGITFLLILIYGFIIIRKVRRAMRSIQVGTDIHPMKTDQRKIVKNESNDENQ